MHMLLWSSPTFFYLTVKTNKSSIMTKFAPLHLSSKTSNTFMSLTHLLHLSLQTKTFKTTQSLHTYLIKTGFLFSSLNLHTKLLLSYATCLLPNTTLHQTFTNFFTEMNPTDPLPFNTIVSDFCRNGFPHLSLHTLSFMHANGVPLDTYALCSSLTASCSIKNVGFGRQMHTHLVKSGGLLSSVYVGSALINLYVKCEVLEDATEVFDEIPVKNTVCANALLSGFAEGKMWDEGLRLVWAMQKLKLEYDCYTMSAVLRVCASLAAIKLGRQVHGHAIRTIMNVEDDVFLQCSLIEMYGKCGMIEKAECVFELMRPGRVEETKRDVVLWTSMLGVYGRNGRFEDVIRLYKEMLMVGVRPDGVVFVAVISACGHTGNVRLGIEYFESMVNDFSLQPNPEHYSCVIDLLCKAGELEKAWKLASEIPSKVDTSVSDSNDNGSISTWGALLNACTDHGNVAIGKLVAQRALELDPHNVGIYVLLSNVYAKVGMWNEIGELRVLMKERGLKKDIGCSWIEVAD